MMNDNIFRKSFNITEYKVGIMGKHIERFLLTLIICFSVFCLGFEFKPKTEQGRHLADLWKEHKYEELISEAKSILAADENNKEIRVILAMSYVKNRQFDAAVVEAEKLLQEDPNNITGNEIIMIALTINEKLDEAFLIANKILGVCPDNVDAHYTMGRYYKRKNIREQCVFHFKKTVEQDPTKELDVAKHLIEYYVKLGECNNARRLSENIFHKIIDFDKKFLKDNSDSYGRSIPNILYSLSICHARDNDSKKALNYLERAIKFNKKYLEKARKDQQLFGEFGKSKEFEKIIAEEAKVTPSDK